MNSKTVGSAIFIFAIMGLSLLVGASSASFTTSTCQVHGTTTTCLTHTTNGTIGYIGCSNTAYTVQGYTHIGGQNLWFSYQTGSGTANKWADPTSTFWTEYSQQLAFYGQPSKVWFQICERTDTPVTDAMVSQAVAILKQHSPNATVYISPLNTYSGGTCSWANWQHTQTLAQDAVNSGLGLAGPVLGPLSATQVQSDGCHPNTSGTALLGSQLEGFFG